MRRSRLPLILVVACACARAPAWQTPDAYALEGVTFAGTGFRAVELDGYGTARGPHWPLRSMPPLIAEDVPEYYRLHGAPAAFLAGSTPAADVVARVPHAWNGAVTVTASAPGWRFTGEGNARQGELRARVVSDRPLPHVVQRVAGLRLEWRASHGSGAVTLGVSRATWYVLLGEPRAPLLHTALELAAAHAQGATDEAELVAGVWSAFARRDVRRARDGRPLRYYGEYLDGAPAELRRLLLSGTGQCVAWSHLLHAAVAAHGVDAEITGVLPPEGGRIYLGPWRFHEGTRFIEAGENGVAESEPAGDDVAFLERGRGVPHARIWAPEPLPIGRLGGDDTLAYMVGRNGLAETRVDTALALPLLARGFGLEQQPAYELETGADITPRGDDMIATRQGKRFLLTGANGVLETDAAPGLRPTAGWLPVVGEGSTALRVQGALPRPWPLTDLGGDDREWGWRLTTGGNGVSQTRGAATGRGQPHAAVIGPGPNGIIDTPPGGDDRTIDVTDYLRAAPAGYAFVSGLSAWPEPGAEAQQNPWPPTEYPNHVLVRIGDRFFDPSFGRGPFASPLDWERALLAGVGVRVLRHGEALLLDGRPAHAVRRADGTRQLTRFVAMEPPH